MVTYEKVEKIAHYLLVKHVGTQSFYVTWYDPEARTYRRRSLKTKKNSTAINTVQHLVDSGVVGDPSDALQAGPLTTVNELLDWHKSYASTLKSEEAELIHIARMKRRLGSFRLGALVLIHFEKFRDDCVKEEGHKITTVSRTLTTMRSAVKRAIQNKLLNRDQAPHVPEFRKKRHVRAAPPKGRLMSLNELAKLIDATIVPHLLWFIVLLVNTGSRPGALFDLGAEQIDATNSLIALNPRDRPQTEKFRPTLPITDTLRPWIVELPPGPIITWRGHKVEEVDTGFRAACRRAGLPGGETPYSVRHMLGRYLRQHGVPDDQIALWLGHIQPPNSNETTLIYSPYAPTYMREAKAGVESFVRELNELTTRDLLAPPRPR